MQTRPVRLICIIFICVYALVISIAWNAVSPEKRWQLTLINKDSLPPIISKDVIKITRKWELPDVLKEISGIDYLDSERLACIQDEIGSVFIYNLDSGVIESEIPFGPPGDYEALAIVKEDAYVACADGRLYEIAGFASAKPVVKEYGTHLTVKQNIEGLTYDPKNKRLLVAIKGGEGENRFFKGIYAFDLVTKKMPVRPVIRIDLQDSVFAKSRQKQLQNLIQPSEITIHPITGDLYVLDATRPQLLVMDNAGRIKTLIALNKADFSQPEGMTFTPSGECYISVEGKKQRPGRLLLVELGIEKINSLVDRKN